MPDRSVAAEADELRLALSERVNLERYIKEGWDPRARHRWAGPKLSSAQEIDSLYKLLCVHTLTA